MLVPLHYVYEREPRLAVPVFFLRVRLCITPQAPIRGHPLSLLFSRFYFSLDVVGIIERQVAKGLEGFLYRISKIKGGLKSTGW
jgi:hypothetical protein